MIDFFTAIFDNEPLVIAGISWCLAALLKFLLVAITSRKLDWERLLGTGGMPSTHTTPVIALAFVFSIVVAYDAAGLRRHTGDQAKAINNLITDLTKHGPYKGQEIADFFKRWNLQELQTLVGHNPMEVLVGVILGIMTALVVHFEYGHLFPPVG